MTAISQSEFILNFCSKLDGCAGRTLLKTIGGEGAAALPDRLISPRR